MFTSPTPDFWSNFGLVLAVVGAIMRIMQSGTPNYQQNLVVSLLIAGGCYYSPVFSRVYVALIGLLFALIVVAMFMKKPAISYLLKPYDTLTTIPHINKVFDGGDPWVETKPFKNYF